MSGISQRCNIKLGMFKTIIKKITPVFLLLGYHFLLAFLGAVFYGFPSRKLKIIGVTGTKGKTTVCSLICHIFNYCDLKTGMATTVNFRIGNKEWANAAKQTMPGRWQLQKLLAQMVQADCKYAVIETSSEGILQYRHKFIDYSVAVFTNLYPEHIERHGSFENYRSAKVKLFEKVAKKKDSVGIYNLDDDNTNYFTKPPIKNKFGFTLQGKNDTRVSHRFVVSGIELFADKSIFYFDNNKIEISLIGKFNVENAAAAISVALSQNLKMEEIKKALLQAKAPPGRLEVINEGQDFKVIVDYSYEQTSLENALEAVRVFDCQRIIVVFGSAAGGRDKWRRPAMGKVADQLADIVIVTTDDPYDEDPANIVDDILKAILENKNRTLGENVFRIIDRREAIREALRLAGKNDLILFAGKGGEQWMNVANGKKIPWQEAGIVREELKDLKQGE